MNLNNIDCPSAGDFFDDERFVQYAKSLIKATVSPEFRDGFRSAGSPSKFIESMEGRYGNRAPGLLGGQIAAIFQQLCEGPITRSSFVDAVHLAASLLFHNRHGLDQEDCKAMLGGLFIALKHPKWWQAIESNRYSEGTVEDFIVDGATISYFDENLALVEAHAAMHLGLSSSAFRSDVWCFNCGGVSHTVPECGAPSRPKTVSLSGRITVNREKSLSRLSGRGSTGSRTRRPPRAHLVELGDPDHAYSAEVFIATSPTRDTFLLNTGAGMHVCNDLAILHDYVPLPNPLPARGVGLSLIYGHGTLKVVATSGQNLTLRDTAYIPECSRNLISLGKLSPSDVNFTRNGMVSTSKTGPIARYDPATHLWLCTFTATQARPSEVHLLDHLSLGHPGAQAQQDLVKYIKEKCNETPKCDTSACSSCLMSKATRTYSKKSTETRTVAPLDLIHADVYGHEMAGLNGEKYYLVLLDDFTRFLTVYPMKAKSDAAPLIIDTITQWEKYFHNRGGYCVTMFRSDNGGEFVNGQLKSFFRNRGIQFQTTVPYLSFQNGAAERAIRTITDKARTLLTSSGAPLTLWPFAVQCAVHLLNRYPNKGVTPYEQWYSKTPLYGHLVPFGCAAYPLLHESKRLSKMAPNSWRGVMVGYALNKKAHLVLDPTTGRVITACHVRFVHDDFPLFKT